MDCAHSVLISSNVILVRVLEQINFNLLRTDLLAWIHVQELLCQFRSLIMKLEDDVRLTGGSKNMASGEHQTRAQELKNQMAQLTQENVIIS